MPQQSTTDTADQTPVTDQPGTTTDSLVEPVKINGSDDDIASFMQEIGGERKFSADTVINEETNVPEVDLSSANNGAQKAQLSEKQALDNTETLFNLRETVQSYGLAYYCDGSFKTAHQYEYEADEKRRLIRAWSRVIGHYNVNVSPWVDVLVTEAVCTGPMVALAYNNRSQRIELERQREIIAQQNEELNRLKGTNTTSQPVKLRRDTKTAWTIDEDGFFSYTEAGVYTGKGKRTEKPPLTPEAYELLTKHNGKEFVDKVFNL